MTNQNWPQNNKHMHSPFSDCILIGLFDFVNENSHIYDTFSSKSLDRIRVNSIVCTNCKPLGLEWIMYVCVCTKAQCRIHQIEWNSETRYAIKSSCQNQHAPIKKRSFFDMVSPFLRLSTHDWRHRFGLLDIRSQKYQQQQQQQQWKKSLKIEMLLKRNWRKIFTFFLKWWCLQACEHAHFICANEMYLYCCSLFLVLRKKIDTFCMAESEPL